MTCPAAISQSVVLTRVQEDLVEARGEGGRERPCLDHLRPGAEHGEHAKAERFTPASLPHPPRNGKGGVEALTRGPRAQVVERGELDAAARRSRAASHRSS